MTDKDDPQEIEQDLRETIREEYLKETVEPPEIDDGAPINDIEVKEPEQVEEVAEIEEAESVEAVEEVAEEVESIELPELTPNDLWPPEFKEKFTDMPRDAQQFLIDTHREMQKGLTQKFTEIADYRREQEDLNTDFQRIDGFLQHNGIPRLKIQKDAIRHIANIIEDPIPGTKLFLKEMGVDINKLVETEEYVDPQFQAVNQELQTLKNQRLQEQQQIKNQGIEAAKVQLNAFINETTEQGHLKHPRYEELRPYMTMFLGQDTQAGQAQRPLPEYYAMAERFVEAQTPQTDPQRIQEQPSKPVTQVKKSASKNIKSKTNTKTPAQLSLREDIKAQYRAMNG